MSDSPVHAQLRGFVAGWVDLARLQTLADLRADQRPPWASLSEGAAGTAYALWYVGHRTGDAKAVAGAGRWWRFADAAAARRSGFRGKGAGSAPVSLGASAVFGRPGVHLVATLVEHQRERPRAMTRAYEALARAVRRAALPEFMVGAAGGLASALLVDRVTGARGLADEIAERLLHRAALPGLAFAHGRAGVQHALLLWSQRTGHALPGAVLGDLAAPTPDEIVGRDPAFARTWCNGLPGFVLLWARAFEVTGDEVWRTRAVAAMHRLRVLPPRQNGTLCCGAGGEAYAALAVARIDASEDWRGLATTLCTRALAQTGMHGVFQGLPGLACLAVDLTTSGPARFPLVEA